MFLSQAVQTDFGLEVLWNGIHAAKISVPSAYKGALCGLCGMYSIELNTFIQTDHRGRMRVCLSNDLLMFVHVLLSHAVAFVVHLSVRWHKIPLILACAISQMACIPSPCKL